MKEIREKDCCKSEVKDEFEIKVKRTVLSRRRDIAFSFLIRTIEIVNCRDRECVIETNNEDGNRVHEPEPRHFHYLDVRITASFI